MPYASPSTSDPATLQRILNRRTNRSEPALPADTDRSDDGSSSSSIGRAKGPAATAQSSPTQPPLIPSTLRMSTNVHNLSLDLQPPQLPAGVAAAPGPAPGPGPQTPTHQAPTELANADTPEILKFARESTQAYSYAQLSQNSLALRLNVLKRSLEILSERPELFPAAHGDDWMVAPSAVAVPGSTGSNHRNSGSGNFHLQANASSAALSALFRQGQGAGAGPGADAAVSSPMSRKVSLNDPQTAKQQLDAIEAVSADVRAIVRLLDTSHVMQIRSQQPQKIVNDLHDLSLLNLTDPAQEDLKIRLLHALATPFVENSNSNIKHMAAAERQGASVVSLTALQAAQMASPASGGTPATGTANRPFHSMSTNKKVTPQAIFTCDLDSPWSMKAANDLACLMFGVSRSSLRAFTLMDLIASRSRDFVLSKLLRSGDGTGTGSDNATVFAGEIIAIQRPNNNFAWTSIWGKRKDSMMILIFDQIPCDSADMVISKVDGEFVIDSFTRHNGNSLFDGSMVGKQISVISRSLSADIEDADMSVDASAKIKTTRYYTVKVGSKNVPSAITAVTLDSDSDSDTPTVKLNIHAMPYIAGTVVISSRDYSILSYNAAACKNLFGYSSTDLSNLPIDFLIPNFSKLLRYAALKDRALDRSTMGLVLPEHYFRKAASLVASNYDDDEAEFLFLNSDGILAKHRDGNTFKVDVQLRVTSLETLMIWITYTRHVTKPPAGPDDLKRGLGGSGGGVSGGTGTGTGTGGSAARLSHAARLEGFTGNRSVVDRIGDDPTVAEGMRHRQMTEDIDLPSQLKLLPENENDIQSCGSSTDGLSRAASLNRKPFAGTVRRNSSTEKLKQRQPLLEPLTPSKAPSLSNSTASSSHSNTLSTDVSRTPPSASEYRSPINSQEFHERSIYTVELNGSVQKHYSEKELLDLENEAIKTIQGKSTLWPREVGLKRREKKLSDFVVMKNMGEGAYGRVVQVQHKDDPYYKLIIKCIVKERILVDTWVRDRKLGTVPSEIQIMYTLNSNPHPNIMRIVDFFEDADYYYLETPQHGDPPGIDLFDLIEIQTAMSETECKFIFRQIVQAVHHLHKNGIIHRDIKDENIIIDNQGIIKLIDFGSASYVKNGPFDVFVGTIDYASPEVLNGKPYEGGPQDVWAMGVLLYTLIYKENPFYNVDEIMEGELRLPFVTSDECVNLIKKILSRDISKRPTMRQILDDPWLRF